MAGIGEKRARETEGNETEVIVIDDKVLTQRNQEKKAIL
jgi:hypothetical protein